MSQTQTSADEARHRLYEIMKSDQSFEAKASEALELGRTYLGVESGFLTRVDTETDHWETIITTDGSEGLVPSGTTTELSGTYCRHTLERDSPLALHDAPKQGYRDDPGSDHFHCYHGTTLTVGSEPYGTACFVAREPRAEPFSEAEMMFAELIGRLLGHELQYQRQQDELARQTSLVNLLDRVLRHNIRNKMTIIRASANLQAADGDPGQNKIVSAADDLIEMSETARHLGKILNSEFDRKPVDLRALAERVTTEIATAYPGATISLRGPDRLVVPALPSLETAVWELVENAAEHAGSEPTIEVTLRETPDTVEIEVADDGPGIPETERDVLQTGTETQLVHGSGLGLWSVYWVGSAHDGEIATETADGTTVTISLPRHPAESADSEPQVRRAGDRFQAAFEHAPAAMALLDDDDHLLDVNDSAATMFGRPVENLIGRQLSAFTEQRPTDGPIATHETGELVIEHEDAAAVPVEYSCQPDIVPGQHLLTLEER
jgi:nitrogen-specific signal transduction histidine kinase